MQKFINYISEVREPHLLLKIDDILELIKNYFEDEVKIQVSNELPSLEDRVTQFYEQKNSKCREKLKRQSKNFPKIDLIIIFYFQNL